MNQLCWQILAILVNQIISNSSKRTIEIFIDTDRSVSWEYIAETGSWYKSTNGQEMWNRGFTPLLKTKHCCFLLLIAMKTPNQSSQIKFKLPKFNHEKNLYDFIYLSTYKGTMASC